MALLEIKNIHKNFGGIKAVNDFSLVANKGEIHGIIGPNGAGKTSIFNTITGIYNADQGQIFLDGKEITHLPQYQITRMGIARTFQNIRLFSGLTVEENILCAFDFMCKYNLIGGLLPTKLRFKEEKRARELCRNYLEIFGMLDYLHEKPENLSYGNQRKIEIVRALMCEPKILLLDEPAAGLTPTEVSELTDLLNDVSKKFGFAVLLIEHRLDLVMSLCETIHVLNFGETIAVGTAEEVQNNPKVIEAYLGVEE